MMKSDWELGHVGLGVRDWDIPWGYYQSTEMGVSVGPQIVTRDFQELNAGPSKSFYNSEVPEISGGSGPGKPVDPAPQASAGRRRSAYRFIDKDCQVGTLLLEILPYPNIPFEGITHLCYNVPDPEGETAELTDKGCQTVLSFTRGEKILENYMDTRRYGNVIVSFRPPVARWEKAWTAHNLSHPILRNWEFQGMGIAVRDIDKTVEYYQYLDIAEFQPESVLDSGSLEDIQVAEGTAGDVAVKARTRTAMVGPVAFDFVQPLEGEAIYRESLDSRGEGVFDLSFTVDNLAEETADLVRRGIPVTLGGKPKDGPEFAYFDTRESSGNIMIRLIQAPPAA